MAENNKKMPTTSKLNLKSKRPATVKVAGAKFNETVNPGSAGHSIPSNPSSNATLQVDYGKKRSPTTRSAGIKTNETVSAGSAGDSNNSMPILNSTVLQIEHGKFLRAMLEECLVSEKIQREETQMDIQLALLADRFQKTIDQLDKTNRRLKEVSFVTEQKRLLDLKRQDCAKYYDLTEESNAKTVMDNLAATEQACLDKLDVINVDSGYDKDTGHKQLLDAVTDALDGLEQIKRKSMLNMDTFKQYLEMEENIKHVDSERREFEGLKDTLQNELPRFGETALKQISESVVGILDDDDDDDLSS